MHKNDGTGLESHPSTNSLTITSHSQQKTGQKNPLPERWKVPFNDTEKEDSGINFDRLRLEDIKPGLPSDWVGEAVDSNYEAWLPVSTEMGRDQHAHATAREPEGPQAKTGAQYARVQRHRRML